MHPRRARARFSDSTCWRKRTGVWASRRSPVIESKTSRVGFNRSISSSTDFVVSLSSTSDGWKTVYCSSASTVSSGAVASKILTPSKLPAVRLGHLADFIGRLCKDDVQHRLAAAHALHKKLQTQRGFSRACPSFQKVQAVAGQPAGEDIVEAFHTRGKLVSVCLFGVAQTFAPSRSHLMSRKSNRLADASLF